MADRYWVGGSDTWNSTAGTKWASTSGGTGGASNPNQGDDVYFDANSGSGAIVTVPGLACRCRSLTTLGFTGSFSESLSGASILIGNGNVILDSLTTFGSGLLFKEISTLYSNGVSLATINVNGILAGSTPSNNATLTLGNNLTAARVLLSNNYCGINTAGYSMNVDSFVAANSGVAGSFIDFRDSNITLYGGNAEGSLAYNPGNASAARGLMIMFAASTMNAVNSTITLVNSTAKTVDCTANGATDVSLVVDSVVNARVSGNYASVRVTGGTGAVTIISGNLTTQAFTSDTTNTWILNSNRGGLSRTVSCPNDVELNKVVISHLDFAGGGTFTAKSSFAANTVTGITVTAPVSTSRLTRGAMVRG